MVSRGRVSQWGPNAQGVRSRPDRSVSLRDVRDLPVQMMALGQGGAPGKFGGGYGVQTRISESDGEYRVRLFIDGEYQAGADYFADDIEEATETAKAMEEDAHLSDKTSDVARDEARDFVEDAIMRPDLDEVEVPEDLDADDARLPVRESRGLTADEAFQQHMAMSGSGQEHLPGMEPEPDPRPPWALTDKQRAAGKEWIPKVRKTLAGSQAPPPSSERIASPLVSRMSGPNFDAIEEGDYGTTPWWDSVPGLDDIPEFDDPYGDELEQMDFRGREQAAWDSAGLGSASDPSFNMFGGMGEAVQGLTARVAEMSGTERAALISALVAAGLLTVGSGGVLAPAGAALLGGAGMAAMNP